VKRGWDPEDPSRGFPRRPPPPRISGRSARPRNDVNRETSHRASLRDWHARAALLSPFPTRTRKCDPSRAVLSAGSRSSCRKILSLIDKASFAVREPFHRAYDISWNVVASERKHKGGNISVAWVILPERRRGKAGIITACT